MSGPSEAAGRHDAGSDASPDPASPERTPAHLVIGLGASAGGLEAYREFFASMPTDLGMRCVLVQHLDPRYESALASIVATYTAMPVETAADGMRVEPDRVYVIPPDAILTIRNDTLRVVQPAPPAARRTSINTFLVSLAEDKGEDAIGIILSGFGSDGALGIAAIKEHGGLTLSQAEYDHHAKSGMPQSAASGGSVDYVLPASGMPEALVEYRRNRLASDAARGPDGLRHDLHSHLPAVCAVLNARLGRDFSQYKPGTLMRRIQRRMHVRQTEQVSDYLQQLRTRPDEAELLFHELLIGVTRFFRDGDTFEAVENRILPRLLADLPGDEPVRVWVAGCATGEEAYTVAILLKEAVAASGRPRTVQVFATDVDARVIEVARAGLYEAPIVADLSPERLQRHFLKEDGRYRIAKDLREMCLFSVHDLVKDPPFSRLDLVTCRNLMIYFDPELQARVLTTFHYALRPDRFLLLGSSESAGAGQHLFEPLDRRRRIFVRRDAPTSLPGVSSAAWAQSRNPARPPSRHAPDDIDRRAARAMTRYAPAFLVVDRKADILRFSGHTAKYLEPATGVASLNLFGLLHAALRRLARGALEQAAVTGRRVVHEAICIDVGPQCELVTLIVEPLPPAGGDELFLVAFQEAGPAAQDAVSEAEDAASTAARDDAAVEALERELRGTRERLRDANEALETVTAELQSANEEYLSVNEELQSANEELETSKEELQSLNEELQTINAELTQRNDSLVRSSSDLANLFDSTSIATLFLDNQLRIRRFTPQVLGIFKVREGDEGRPITDIVTRLSRDGLGDDVRQVLQTLVPVEREVMLMEADVSYLMQVRPYRDVNDVVDGAVVTFVDITERRKSEQTRALLAAIVESSQDAIIGHDLDGVVTSWNAGAEALYGFTADEAIGRILSTLLRDSLLGDWPDMRERLSNGEQIASFERSGTDKDGRAIDVAITLSPVRQAGGRIVGASLVARDVGERKAAEQRAALLLGELDHRVKNILAIVMAVISQTLRFSETPEAFAREVEGRVVAIAKAHGLLTNSGHGGILLSALVATELAPFDHGNGNVSVSGPDVELTPRAGLALAMAVHELASNAAKYGALSAAEGRLAVTWEIVASAGEELVLTLAWSEAGGPPVRAPTRRGFGTTLIERAIRHDFNARVTREFLPTGVRCTLAVPLGGEFGRPVPPDKETPR